MKPQSESVNVHKDIRTVRNDARNDTSDRRTIYDVRLRNALVIYANSTR